MPISRSIPGAGLAAAVCSGHTGNPEAAAKRSSITFSRQPCRTHPAVRCLRRWVEAQQPTEPHVPMHGSLGHRQLRPWSQQLVTPARRWRSRSERVSRLKLHRLHRFRPARLEHAPSAAAGLPLGPSRSFTCGL